jgi:hypothetical protein
MQRASLFWLWSIVRRQRWIDGFWRSFRRLFQSGFQVLKPFLQLEAQVIGSGLGGGVLDQKPGQSGHFIRA